ncbi:MAG: RidA family protein [SAR202 cluster bacterium]|jgi:enamine deaminase RidA (YjgF/YER057c/UK114 family)|nr:RidA family protein [SAR202 cluster bacterium]
MPRNSFFPNLDNKPSGFSPATRVGNIVFSSGQVAADADGNVVGEGDAGAQSEQVFKNIEAALNAAGASMSDVTKITAFLLNNDDYPAYAAARAEAFNAPGPASSTVFVSSLVSPAFLVEVEATAVVSG